MKETKKVKRGKLKIKRNGGWAEKSIACAKDRLNLNRNIGRRGMGGGWFIRG